MKTLMVGLMSASVLSSAAFAGPYGLQDRSGMRHNDLMPAQAYEDDFVPAPVARAAAAAPVSQPTQAPAPQEYQVADASTYPYGAGGAGYYTPQRLPAQASDFYRPATEDLLSPTLKGAVEPQPAPPPQPQPFMAPMPQQVQEVPAAVEPAEQGLPLPMGENPMVISTDNVAEAPAASEAPKAPFTPPMQPNYAEAGLNYFDVTNNQGNWFGQYGRVEIQSDPYNRWNFDLIHQQAFKDNGVYGAIGNTHIFDENWYSDVTVGAATDTFFLPALRADAFINRKWLEDKSFITTFGLGYYGAHETYDDFSAFFGTTWYFMPRWSFQNGVRLNLSTPGEVFAPSAFVALTEGAQGEHFLTLRYGFGREAYQLVGPGNALSKFFSNSISADWKQWLGEDWGYRVRAEHYGNPNYDRNGGSIGIFKEF